MLVQNKNDNKTIFSVKNVDLSYGNKQVLKNVCLDVKEHSVMAFIGPSGCGKSTLLRCFNRMNDLIENCKITGEIMFKEQDINEINEMQLRTNVGMVFQNPNPFPMSIFDNVSYGLRCKGKVSKEELQKIVISSLKKAAIYEEVKDRLHDSALSLSGGQQQRLCIARALANNPEVILMDEPTSALDPIATQKIEELIYDLKKEYTIIIVTHNMQQATRISDYTAFFLLGEIVECSDTLTLFKNPKNKKTEEYITGRFG